MWREGGRRGVRELFIQRSSEAGILDGIREVGWRHASFFLFAAFIKLPQSPQRGLAANGKDCQWESVVLWIAKLSPDCLFISRKHTILLANGVPVGGKR